MTYRYPPALFQGNYDPLTRYVCRDNLEVAYHYISRISDHLPCEEPGTHDVVLYTKYVNWTYNNITYSYSGTYIYMCDVREHRKVQFGFLETSTA